MEESEKPNWWKRVAIGCGVLMVVTIIALAFLVRGCAYLMKDIEGISVTVDSPSEVVTGEQFDLRIVIKNERESKALKVTDVHIENAFLTGFKLVSVEPAAKSESEDDIFDTLMLSFEISIPPGEAQVIAVALEARTPGVFRGEVDVYEGMRSVTKIVETVVKEKE